MPESKYLYRNIKWKQRMIDNIQKYENDKKRKNENEKTMIFNTQIIDYILNQTSICDSQTNINLNSSLNMTKKKSNNNRYVSTRKVVVPANTPSNMNYENEYGNTNNKDKNPPIEYGYKENNGDNNANISGKNNDNLNIFNKFEKENRDTKIKNTNNCKTNENIENNNHNKTEKVKIKKEEKGFASFEFLIEAIDQAENIVGKHPKTDRGSNKLIAYLQQESAENLKEKLIIQSNPRIISSKLKMEKSISQKSHLEINKIDLNPNFKVNSFKEIMQLQEKSKMIFSSKDNETFKYLNSNNDILKISFSKAKQNQNQIENATKYKTTEEINSNLTPNETKYLTRKEIILNNLLLKNSMNKEGKLTISNSNNNYNLKSHTNAVVSTNNINDVNKINKSNNKIEEEENSITKQRKKLEKELNLCHRHSEYNDNYYICNIKNQNSRIKKENLSSTNNNKSPQPNTDFKDYNYKDIINKGNNSDKKNSENLDISHSCLSRNLNNLNNINNVSNQNKTPIFFTSKQISVAQKEKESQLLINKLKIHNHFSSSKTNSGNYNTNIFSSRENLNLNILFNKTNMDFGAKPKLNSNITSQNFNVENNKNKCNQNLLNQQSSQNILTTEHNHNQTQKNNFLSNSQAGIFNKNDPNMKISFKTNNNNTNNNLNIHNSDNIIKSKIFHISDSAKNKKLLSKSKEAAKSQVNSNLVNNTRNSIKVILQGGNTLSKDEIKLSSYCSKENNNTNFFNKSNNTNNTNTAREVILIKSFFIDLFIINLRSN